MTTPVQYQVGMPLLGGSCLVCDSTDRLINDHCHEHGWIRGVLCNRCNGSMGRVDRGLMPKAADRLGSDQPFHAHRARCHECGPIELVPSERKRFVAVMVGPATREALRKASFRVASDARKILSQGDTIEILLSMADQDPEAFAQAARRFAARNNKESEQ